LQQACEGDERDARTHRDYPLARRETAKAFFRVADIQAKLGQHDEAMQAYDNASRLLEKLATDFPTASEYRAELAACHTNRGNLLREASQFAAAQTAYRQALDLLNVLAREARSVP